MDKAPVILKKNKLYHLIIIISVLNYSVYIPYILDEILLTFAKYQAAALKDCNRALMM